jgi:hypothetical protein
MADDAFPNELYTNAGKYHGAAYLVHGPTEASETCTTARPV